MLVLSRKSNETIMIGQDIEVKIVSIHGKVVRLGIQAPAHIPVHREEIFYRITNKIKRIQDHLIKFKNHY